MTKNARDTKWRPHLDLERLSTALAGEIAAMPDRELRRLLAEIGYPIATTAQEVREVIAAASGEPAAAALKAVGPDGQRRVFAGP